MFDYQPRLAGDLIDMRPTTRGDLTPLFAAASDPRVWALHPYADRWREEVFRPYFEDGLASGGALTAICKADGAVAGWSRYSAQFARTGEIEIGWTFLGIAYWGGAYNADMKRIMLAHAFRFVDRVVFRIGEKNLRSRRAAEKIGARPDGRVQVTGEASAPVTSLFYAIAKDDFERAP